MTKDEALASLAEINRVADRIRKAVAAGAAAPMLILWGAIWVLGFAVTQAEPAAAGRVWLGLDLGGILVSLFLGGWSRRTPSAHPHHARVGASWLLLMAYGVLWLLLLVPEAFHAHRLAHALDGGRRIGAFGCTVAMFGYVIMGLWLSRFLLWLGVLITALTWVGLVLLPGYFYFWMAITGGGALIAAGLYVRQAWR